MFVFIILFSLITENVFGANILFISPIESASHHIWGEVLIRGLLEKKHNITLLGHKDARIKSENYTVYKITGTENIYGEELSEQQSNPFMDLVLFWEYVLFYIEPHLKSNALKAILDYPRDKFDLIIFDVVFGQEFYPVIEHFGNPPVVAISPFILPPYILDVMGSQFNFYFPIFTMEYKENLTFLERIENTLLYALDYFLKWHHLPNIYKIAQERYGENITTFDLMERKIGILLANYDPVFDPPQALPPNIISVGGLHVKRSEKLDNDIQEVLDNSNDGVIFFSFGTIVEPTWLPMEKRKIFLNVFSKLKQTVLWKYPKDDLKDSPRNVVFRKWYAQNDILAHKNVKLFITHGGGLSSQEAMYHGVPVLSIPFFVDQKKTAGKMAARMLGKKLLIGEVTENVLHEAISELLDNSIYKQNMQKTSRLFRDQKETPLERAIFWIEYALRNKDLSHLSTNVRAMTLFQRENLDVYATIFLIIIVLVIFLYMVVKYTLKCIFYKRKIKIKQN